MRVHAVIGIVHCEEQHECQSILGDTVVDACAVVCSQWQSRVCQYGSISLIPLLLFGLSSGLQASGALVSLGTTRDKARGPLTSYRRVGAFWFQRVERRVMFSQFIYIVN